jgi:hypothetical protein
VKPSTLIARLQRAEAKIKPQGKMFVMFAFDVADATLAEREREFRSEHEVGPNDLLHTVRFSFNENGHNAIPEK